MSRRPRRNHSPAFKAKVALAPSGGEKTLAERSEQFDVTVAAVVLSTAATRAQRGITAALGGALQASAPA